MDSKRLIIAFFAVSLAALTVSGAAVISVARTYNSMLTKSETSEKSYDPPETSRISEVTEIIEVIETTDTTAAEEDITVSLSEETTTAEITTETVTSPGVFTLFLDSDRLVILSPEGERVYERITDVARIHPKDLEALLGGISFDTREDAMSAVYDVIS